MKGKKHKYITVRKSRNKTFFNFISPLGTAVFPKLVKYDEFKGTKAWKVKLAVPAEEAEEFIGEIKLLLEDFYKQKYEEASLRKRREYDKNWSIKDLWVEEEDSEGNPTGNILLSFSKKAFDSKGMPQAAPLLFDSNNKPIAVDDIWGGSKLRIAGFIYFYENSSLKEFGPSLKIQAVQVVDLKGPGRSGPSAEAYGFEAIEGGYTADPVCEEDLCDTEPDVDEDDEVDF
tara:strand:+ start:5837 stop:6526 length:690 start_codon:yes stop_codon:yes gene_type:complete